MIRIAISTLAFSFATFANAADFPIKSVQYDRSIWDGLYWGASLDGAWYTHNHDGTLRQTTVTTPPGTTTISNGTFSGEGKGLGFLGTGLLGYNMQVGHSFVWGAQVEAGLAHIGSSQTGRTTISDGTNTTSLPYFGGARLLYTASALLRGGSLLNPSTLLYGIGGLTYGYFEYQDGAGVGRFYSPAAVIGAGVEKKVSDRWSLLVEYRYTAFQNRTVGFSTFSSFATGGVTNVTTTTAGTQFHERMQSVRLGITYAP
jgi:opacity protein-like surface antigen